MAKKRFGTPRSADRVLGVPSLELALGILKRLPGAHASDTSDLLASGQYRVAVERRLNPKDFIDPDEFAEALLAVSLLRKYPGFPGSATKVDDAILKWRACEEQCRMTNERIREFRIGQARPDLAEVFRLARSKIRHLLGPFRWSKPAKFFDFGPGSTTRLPFAKRHRPFKFGPLPETTVDNLVNAQNVIALSPVWCESSGGRAIDGPVPCFKIREQSKVTTVPKDAFIDRVIAIEPDMNMFVQKGFGGFIRGRLKHVGIDLDDQSLNQRLAQSASLGGLATLDLASASDTISYELVKELLPSDWFEALLSCRCHESRLPSGEIIQLQKFSSMGNGYTFELESLIFWALCSAVCSETIGREGLRVAVYGDDLIVTVSDYPSVVSLLEFSGFTVNLKKSYADGPYRESCGKHYFHGHDVTPITITKEITHASKLLLICNNLVRWSVRRGRGLYRHSSVRSSYRFCVGNLPDHLRRPKLPDGYGDGALIGSFDECLPQRCRLGWDGWRVSGILLPKRQYRRAHGVHTLAASLDTLERKFRGSPPYPQRDPCSGTGLSSGVGLGCKPGADEPLGGFGTRIASLVNEVTPVSELDESHTLKLGKVFVKRWCDIGPWAP